MAVRRRHRCIRVLTRAPKTEIPVKRVSGGKLVWFQVTDKVTFLESVDTVLRPDGLALGDDPSHSSILQQVYAGQFPPAPQIQIIPAKRVFQVQTPLKTNLRIKPEGEGVLNHLFQAMNSGHPELYDRVQVAFAEITDGYRFKIFTADTPNTLTLHFVHGDSAPVEAEVSGQGLQEVLVLVVHSLASEANILAIEEPENHIHPDMQRRLAYFLRDEADKQFFLATHSNVFLNDAIADKVFFTAFVDNSIQVSDATKRASVLADLGYSISDNLVSDLVILVEGSHDGKVLEEFLGKKGLTKRFTIEVWGLGGDMMEHGDLSVFTEAYTVIALIDKDPGSKDVRERFMKLCREHHVKVHKLKRYSIENYFTRATIRSVLHITGEVPELDPDRKVEDQLDVNVKRHGRGIARAMSLGDIAGTDLEDFLSEVGRLCTRQA